MIGRTLANRYRLQHRLGTGGHGHVYLAEDLRLGHPVAVKTLRTDVGEDVLGELRVRFELEARRVAKLTHPYTVRIFDHGEDREGTPVLFIAMELLQGTDLDSVLRKQGTMSEERVIALVRMICGPLAEAHAAGIVHRDLAPKNIFMCTVPADPDTELIKLIDFGIAKYEESELTGVGMTLGTLEYMSPEQAQGQELDGRSDLYALGIAMCELLTGKVPFSIASERTKPAILIGHVTKPRPYLRDLDPQSTVSAELEAVIRTCIDVQAARRFVTAGALRDALQRVERWLVVRNGGLSEALNADEYVSFAGQLNRYEGEHLLDTLQDHSRRAASPEEQANILLRRGIVAREAIHNMPLAVECFQRVARFAPHSAAAYLALADTHERSRTWDEAVHSLERAASLISQDQADDLHVRVSRLLQQRGDEPAARARLQEVLMRNPGHSAAEDTLTQIETGPTGLIKAMAPMPDADAALSEMRFLRDQLADDAEHADAFERLQQLIHHPENRVAFEAFHVIEESAESAELWGSLARIRELRAARTAHAPTRSGIWADVGAMYLDKLQRPQDSLRCLEHAIEDGPERDDLYERLEHLSYGDRWRSVVDLLAGVAPRIGDPSLRSRARVLAARIASVNAGSATDIDQAVTLLDLGLSDAGEREELLLQTLFRHPVVDRLVTTLAESQSEERTELADDLTSLRRSLGQASVFEQDPNDS